MTRVAEIKIEVIVSRSVVSIQDTKERIFMNGQIYSRPRFGGPVGAPDNRRFTPDSNPYDVEPEPRGFGGALQQVIEEKLPALQYRGG